MTSKELFTKGVEIVGAEYLSDVFNIYLVANGYRKATLIERSGFLSDTAPPNGRDRYSRLKAWIASSHKQYNYNFVSRFDNRITEQILIYNKSATGPEVRQAIDDAVDMGRILGYRCPGDLGERFSFHIYLEDISTRYPPAHLHAEMCREPFPDGYAEQLVKRYQPAADKLGFRLVHKFRYHPKEIDFLRWLDADDIDKLYQYRDTLVSLFWNYDLRMTADIIDNVETRDGFIDLYHKYRLIWKYMTAQIYLGILDEISYKATKILESTFYLNVDKGELRQAGHILEGSDYESDSDESSDESGDQSTR